MVSAEEERELRVVCISGGLEKLCSRLDLVWLIHYFLSLKIHLHGKRNLLSQLSNLLPLEVKSYFYLSGACVGPHLWHRHEGQERDTSGTETQHERAQELCV